MEKKRLDEMEPGALQALGRQWGKAAAVSGRGTSNGTLRELAGLEKTLEKRREEYTGEMAPAAEWLLDNFYLVRRDLGRIREALRRKRRLPRLPGGGLRVLALTDAFTEACGGRAEVSMLRAFLRGAGEETDLEEAELGLLESALRMSLLKRLARSPESAEAVFTGIRALDAMEFSALLEEVSPVEAILTRDPLASSVLRGSRTHPRAAATSIPLPSLRLLCDRRTR